MEDKSIFSSEQPNEISKGLQRFIDSMVEEIVLEGKPFKTQKKYLKKFSVKEGVDYKKLEADITSLIGMLGNLKATFSDLLLQQAEDKARECHISEGTMRDLVKHSLEQENGPKKKQPYPKQVIYGLGGVLLLSLIVFLITKGCGNNDSVIQDRDTVMIVQHDTIVRIQYSTEAEQLYRADAEKGNANAQYYLGCNYYNGSRGLIKNLPEAIKWFKEAADQGNVLAQEKLGHCYEVGDGVNLDYAMALYWYKQSAEKGSDFAKNGLDRIDKVLASLSSSKTGLLMGYEYVDLGLSVNWATCNVGAKSPENPGEEYAWGETAPKQSYTWGNYKYLDGRTRTNCSQEFLNNPKLLKSDHRSRSSNIILSKYTINRINHNIKIDHKSALDPSNDVARIKWGEGWRMPTDDEFKELINECSWAWTTREGVKGWKITSKKEGYTDKYIFFPEEKGNDFWTYYWSRSLDNHIDLSAYCVAFHKDSSPRLTYDTRYCGHLVRPVCEKKRGVEKVDAIKSSNRNRN